MSFFKPKNGRRGWGFVRTIAFPVGAAALALAVQAAESEASTGSSGWNSQPSWSSPSSPSEGDSDSTSPPPQRRSSYRDSRYSNNAPLSPYSPGSNNLALDVGQVFLMGGMGGNYSDAIGTQLHYTYGVSDLFGFDSSLGYSSHSNGALSMTTLLTGLRMNLAWYDKIVPYVIGGMGFYRPSYSQTIEGQSESLSPVLFGVHLGIGGDLALTRQIFFGAALTVHEVFGSQQNLPDGTPIEAGGMFTSFLLHAGVTF